MNEIDQGHEQKRNALRAGGILLLVIGGIFMLVGLVDFFSAFGGMRAPRLFWCFFIGMPLLFVGGAMTGYGFMGAVGRYVAGEGAPVAKDTLNYVAENTQEGVKTVASAVGEGLRDGFSPAAPATATVPCPQCKHANASDARFCSQCGASLPQSVSCPKCGHRNAAEARFCDRCGAAVG